MQNAEYASMRVWKLSLLAEHASVSVETLKRCAKRGELKIIKLSPRRVGVLDSEAKRWLATRAKAA